MVSSVTLYDNPDVEAIYVDNFRSDSLFKSTA